MYLGDRVMGAAFRPKPIGAGLEVGLEDRLEHCLQGGLNNPVADCRNPEATELAAALGDHAFLDR